MSIKNKIIEESDIKTDTLSSLYSELYEAVYKSDKKYKEAFPLSNFVAMRGSRYDERAEDSIRYMMVGRAVNGWGESIRIDSKEIFSSCAVKLFEDRNRFDSEWCMQDKESNPYSEYYNEDKNKQSKYYLSNSPFWETNKRIFQGISGEKKADWFEDVVWNNIYKIAPKNYGNPSTNLIYTQALICVKILKEEIKLLRPTHVLLVIDRSWVSWTRYKNVMFDFMESFDNIVYFQNVVDGDIVQCAFTSNGVKVVIACRPETKNRDTYSDAVINAFKNI